MTDRQKITKLYKRIIKLNTYKRNHKDDTMKNFSINISDIFIMATTDNMKDTSLINCCCNVILNAILQYNNKHDIMTMCDTFTDEDTEDVFDLLRNLILDIGYLADSKLIKKNQSFIKHNTDCIIDNCWKFITIMGYDPYKCMLEKIKELESYNPHFIEGDKPGSMIVQNYDYKATYLNCKN